MPVDVVQYIPCKAGIQILLCMSAKSEKQFFDDKNRSQMCLCIVVTGDRWGKRKLRVDGRCGREREREERERPKVISMVDPGGPLTSSAIRLGAVNVCVSMATSSKNRLDQSLMQRTRQAHGQELAYSLKHSAGSHQAFGRRYH